MPTLRQLRSYERWVSDQPDTERALTVDLTPGRIVIWGKAPFRVISLSDLNPGNWPTEYEEAWDAASRPDVASWKDRPMRLGVQRDTDAADPERSGIVPAHGQWVILPEHYSVCRSCGELPPCPEAFTDRIMAVESHRIDFEMRLVHGTCHGCGKPVSRRERSILFPGDNLIRPDLGANTAVFHTRQSCLPIALSYQDRWLAAEPGRAERISW
ncbi:hypothetical protein [Streptomyces sp. NPDC093589]|uniref:hypothetical protein n=1 Tax=Streptomyces sp. NPDC093589 TaxID=3366043 RepID=UPI00380008F4